MSSRRSTSHLNIRPPKDPSRCLMLTIHLSLQLKHHKLPIIGGKDCDAVTKTPAHNSTFPLGSGIKVCALHTPCHTQDSICYLFEDESTNDRAVFTGDTLFIGGEPSL